MTTGKTSIYEWNEQWTTQSNFNKGLHLQRNFEKIIRGHFSVGQVDRLYCALFFPVNNDLSPVVVRWPALISGPVNTVSSYIHKSFFTWQERPTLKDIYNKQGRNIGILKICFLVHYIFFNIRCYFLRLKRMRIRQNEGKQWRYLTYFKNFSEYMSICHETKSLYCNYRWRNKQK